MQVNRCQNKKFNGITQLQHSDILHINIAFLKKKGLKEVQLFTLILLNRKSHQHLHRKVAHLEKVIELQYLKLLFEELKKLQHQIDITFKLLMNQPVVEKKANLLVYAGIRCKSNLCLTEKIFMLRFRLLIILLLNIKVS